MSADNIYLPLVTAFFDQDMSAASLILENMSEEEAAGVLQSLPTALVLRILKKPAGQLCSNPFWKKPMMSFCRESPCS